MLILDTSKLEMESDIIPDEIDNKKYVLRTPRTLKICSNNYSKKRNDCNLLIGSVGNINNESIKANKCANFRRPHSIFKSTEDYVDNKKKTH